MTRFSWPFVVVVTGNTIRKVTSQKSTGTMQTIGGKMQLQNKNLMFLQYTCQDDMTYHGCFLVLQKLLLVSYCVAVWLLFCA